MKKILSIVVLSSFMFIAACSPVVNTCEEGYHLEADECVLDVIDEPKDDEPSELASILDVDGVDNKEVALGYYFDPFEQVTVLDSNLDDISHLLTVYGHVDYSREGTYELTYELNYNDDSYSTVRTITVSDIAPNESYIYRPMDSFDTVVLGEGSYVVGPDSTIDHPIIPNYIDNDLLKEAIPSSSWWTSLLVQNYGGSNGIYTNPLRVSYTNDGMEITNPEDGFVQYWNDGTYQTMAQYPIAMKDAFIKSSGLASGYETHVIDYGSSHVKVAMRNFGSDLDVMVATLTQGSPFVTIETGTTDEITYTLDTNGVVGYDYFSLDGTFINDTTFTGTGLIVKMNQRHSGYDTSLPANVGSPQYSDKYYMIITPENTTFTLGSKHPFGLSNQVTISMTIGNVIQVAAINSLSESSFYLNHSQSVIYDTDIDYSIDYLNSLVETNYAYQASYMTSDDEMLIALMPHHYKYSSNALTDYEYESVRGTLKVLEGSSFSTQLQFSGVLPGFTAPTSSDYDQATALLYLSKLDEGIDLLDEMDFINDEGPYWNSKAIYPLSQGIIIADQIGNDTLKQSYIDKLKYVLEDWFTVSGDDDEKYLYYNSVWGSTYYSNNDFNTAETLSDHSFTHGYLIFASAVLSMYDQTFYDDYHEMVDLLLDDYMNVEEGSSDFAYLRNFDAFAGHTWAHGFGTFAEGNNLESSSEALNSWNAGYLWALQSGDQARMDAAIYGFVTELSAIKEYWFDYDDTNWDPDYGDYVDVAGMVWGGKFDYATWFGADPTFIYGIQWLPTGEYLTSLALDEEEFNKLDSIYDTYLSTKSGVVNRWYSMMWAVDAITDPDHALSVFDSASVLSDEYPNELIGSYWMITALDGLGARTNEVWMDLSSSVASSIYTDPSGQTVAMIWNPTNVIKIVDFYNESGLLTSIEVSPNSFDSYDLNE
jgi:endo-1,3(4)-beta-glucanase